MPRPTTALIVDDESHARTYIRMLLQELGITTFWEAGDGVQALSLFAEHRPEVVLLDVNLRMMNGLQVLQQIKKQQPDVPVIMLSSESALKTVHEAVRLGALAYVLKHSPKDSALQTLAEALASLDEDAAADGAPPPGESGR